MFEEKIVAFSSLDPGAVSIVGYPIFIDKDDFKGVHIAAQNLSEDFGRVTRQNPSPVEAVDGEPSETELHGDVLMIVGCIEHNRLLQTLEQSGKVNFGAIRGQWESFMTAVIEQPFQNPEQKAFIIAGSDKRGTIFGAYTLSEQIGVSPFYWWADVPPKYNQSIYAIPKTTKHGEPSVQYRGIFLNDEAPALTGWVLEKFGAYNSEFYKKVFELLLRLKANFLWPAMWPGYPNPGASFFTDDPLNQRTADEYGIVMSTSHHEPMQRLANEWFAENGEGTWNWEMNKDNIKRFFHEGAARARDCESYFTLGMRGEFDNPLAASDPAVVISEAIQAQREIFKEIYGQDDQVPQLLPLYRDIEAIFDTGRLQVPDDVTLLFQDDNHGILRRLPNAEQQARKGGSGMYYHFQYVGEPRSYKWNNSVALGKAWHQLRYAYNQNVRKLWLFNVGDLKPLENPISWAMTLAWDINSITANNLSAFMQTLAERDFGPKLCKEIGSVYHRHSRLISMRKHEMIEPDTFSHLHYSEAETVLASWSTLLAEAERIYDTLPTEQKAAAYQLMLHPVKSTWAYVALRIMQGRNTLYGRQRRNTTNTSAQKCLELFDTDFDIQEEYHALLGGKWNHIMRQTHMGYGDTWHAPSRDMITGLSFIQRRQNSNPIVGQMGIAVEGHEGVRAGRINEESERTHPSRRDLVPGLTLGGMSPYGPGSRWFDVFTRGTPTVHWMATVPHSWLQLSQHSGLLVPGKGDDRVHISVDWERVPEDFSEMVLIDVRSGLGDFEQIHLPITSARVPPSFINGFVEASGHVSMPAISYVSGPDYIALPDNGRTDHGSVSLNVSNNVCRTESFLSYPFYQFSDSSEARVQLTFSTTLATSNEDLPSYDWHVDESAVSNQVLVGTSSESIAFNKLHGHPATAGWPEAASSLVWKFTHAVQGLGQGAHAFKIRLRHPNMLLENIVVDFGGLRQSYLGPPPSHRIQPDRTLE